MITISNCPTTGLQRKLDYDFMWFRELKQIIIDCKIKYFKDDVLVSTLNSNKKLVASTGLVNSDSGEILSSEQVNLIKTREQRILQYQSDYTKYLTAIENNQKYYNEALSNYEQAMIDWKKNGPQEVKPSQMFPEGGTTKEPVEPSLPSNPEPPKEIEDEIPHMEEYDFYIKNYASKKIVLPELNEKIINQRDSQGFFNNLL